MRGRVSLVSIILTSCLLLLLLSACAHNESPESTGLSPLNQDSAFPEEQMTTPDTLPEDVTTASEPTVFAPDCRATVDDEKVLDQLKSLAADADAAEASIFYTSLDGVYSYVCGESRSFHTQSTIKAPYIFFVLSDAGENLDNLLAQTLCLQSGQLCDGMGSVRNFPIGTSFTVEDLVKYTLRESDNTAYRMLYDHFGTQAFNTHSEALGLSMRLSVDPFCMCTASELATMFLAIVNSDSPASDLVLEHLKNTTTNFLIGAALPGTPIAHKYGLSTVMHDCHDCAIVYDEHPYLLVILSKYNPDSQNPYGEFRGLTQEASAVHRTLFGET